MTSTPKGIFWRVRNSWWILFPFTILFNWIAFFIIGYKVKLKKWSIYGAIYSIPFILLLALGRPYDTNQWQWDVIGYSLFGGGITSIIHAFRIRKEYLIRLEAVELRKPEEEKRLRGQIEAEYGIRYNQFPPQETPISHHTNSVYPNPSTQQAQIQPNSNRAASKSIETPLVQIDLNRASELELANLPGVGAILAKKAMNERERSGGFRSLEDFGQLLGLKPHIIEKIRPHVMVTPPKEPPSQQWSGRMVDY